jgi:hypothetical protein
MRSCLVLTAILVLCTNGRASAQTGGVEVLRGDGNNDTHVNISDPIYINNFLFYGGNAPPCMDAADANDDGAVNSSDVVYLYSFLFSGGPKPPAPYPSCGHDPSSDSLSCNNSACP